MLSRWFNACRCAMILSVALASKSLAQPGPAPATQAGSLFSVMLSPGEVPCVVHVNGLNVAPAAGTPITALYDWDFGDPTAKFNRLPGFNAAHVYDHPGQYTITFTLTDEAGHQSQSTATVTITPDTRRRIYVSPEGSDYNTGTSPDAPFQSLPRAFKALTNDGELLLKAGSTFEVGASLRTGHKNIVIGRYGDGPDPKLIRLKGNGSSTIALDKSCDAVVIEHLTFDSPNAVDENRPAPQIGSLGVNVSGRNIAIRSCTFLNLDDGVNSNGEPTGLLVQECNAPLVTGLRGYLVWGQGTDHVYLGNFAANSTRQHNVRMSGVRRILIDSNNFTNLDRTKVDKDDYSKGAIEMHKGYYAWISHNTVAGGTIRVGPRGGDVEPDMSTATEWCVIDSNIVNGTRILSYSGARHIMIRNNVIHNDNDKAIEINGGGPNDRSSDDFKIIHNTAINDGPGGSFLKLWGRVNGIILDDNLFVAPNLKANGSTGSAAVNIDEPTLSSFREISHNVWPPSRVGDGAIHSIGAKKGGHYVNADKWNQETMVHDDRFADVTVDEHNAPAPGSAADGYAEPTPLVTRDFTGQERPKDRRTVGAVEVGTAK
jgi:PKD repeat protein